MGQLVAGCSLPPRPGKHHPTMGLGLPSVHGVLTGGGGEGVATGSWLSCQPHRAPSACEAGRAGAPACGAGAGALGLGVPAFSIVHRGSRLQQAPAAGSWLQGKVAAVGLTATWLGRLGGCGGGEPGGPLPYPEPCPQPPQLSSHLGLETWGPPSQLRGHGLRG